MHIRKAYCKGWYPSNLDEIKKYMGLSASSPKPNGKKDPPVSFAVCPHAGWEFSGRVAGSVYSLLHPADTFVFLATNHTGLGKSTSLFPEGIWDMPLGSFKVDADFSGPLLKNSKSIEPDIAAHMNEHAVEVQLPFLHLLNPEAKIVPIEMRDYRLEVCREVAQAIARTVEETLKKNPSGKISVIASTDMTHCGASYGQTPPGQYSAGEFARCQDRMAIDQMLSLNSEKLQKVVHDNDISMCGLGPATALVELAKLLGAKKGELIKYSTSSDVLGEDSDMAVGYAGIVLE